MGEQATERVRLKPSTKQLVDEVKPDGVTYDYWVQNDPRLGGADE